MMAGDVKWIPQEDPHGCGFAALAMVTGKTYVEVKAWFTNPRLRDGGLTWHEMAHFLTEHGFAFNFRWPVTQNEETNKYREVWPPEPWADVALIEVLQPSNNYHYVVLLKNGQVFDPLTSDAKTLADYPRVDMIIAVYPIRKV